MSLIDPLLRFIDPIQFRKQQEEYRQKREGIPPDFEPEPLDELPPLAIGATRQMECRICGAGGTGRFCLDCLAETMVDVTPAAEPSPSDD